MWKEDLPRWGISCASCELGVATICGRECFGCLSSACPLHVVLEVVRPLSDPYGSASGYRGVEVAINFSLYTFFL